MGLLAGTWTMWRAQERLATVKIQNTLIRGCVAPSGGGISLGGNSTYNLKSVVTLCNVAVDSCVATTNGGSYGNGGGLFLNLCKCYATNLYLINNEADSLGGGAGVTVGALEFYLNDSWVVGNQAGFAGAGIYDPDTSFTVQSNTVMAYNGWLAGGDHIRSLRGAKRVFWPHELPGILWWLPTPAVHPSIPKSVLCRIWVDMRWERFRRPTC